MRLFDSVEYALEYTESRNAAGFGNADPKRWIEGDGKYVFRSDGRRWFLDEHGLSFNLGDKSLTPKHDISGFDGGRHYHCRGDSLLVYGEDELGNRRAGLPLVLWRCGSSAENLLYTLRLPEARIIGRPKIGGQACVTIEVRWIPEWDQSRLLRRLEVTISPEQSYLPLKAVWERDGKVTSECELNGLKRTAGGVWYPLMIRTNRQMQDPPDYPLPRTEKIKSVVFRDSKQEPWAEDAFRFTPPLGVDIVDRRRGVAWCNDPWWAELAPFAKEKFDWPRADTAALIYAASYNDPAIDDAPAPVIEAADWVNGKDPGPWQRAGRFVSVLYFFDDLAIAPHPGQIAALRAWRAKYAANEVELVGIAGHHDVAEVKRSIAELGIDFPVAIDQKSDNKQSYGRTRDAFHLRQSAGIVIVTPAGHVKLLPAPQGNGEPRNPLDVAVLPLFEMAGRRPQWAADAPLKPATFKQMNPQLTDAARTQIQAEWRRQVLSQTGRGKVQGLISHDASLDAAIAEQECQVTIQPELWLLLSNTPGGHFVDVDANRRQTVAVKGSYEFSGLRKGTYRLSFSAPGVARVERKVLLETDDAITAVDVSLQSDTIRGQVQDETGEPFSGVSVRVVLRHLAPPQKYPTTTSGLPREPIMTDSDGRFVLDQLPAGAYTLEFSVAGFDKAEVELVSVGTRDLSVVLPAAKPQ
ncbi:MAG: carboxypeptidase regulatory-like domain-containing protein [Planctomycetes bacterium]|nr:carboxypeptidase regulatory-like domain-containing protein [Planctomycetota bacterium]